jgi:Tfp pilus assembly protein PilF
MKVFFLLVLTLFSSVSLYAQRQYSTTDKEAIKQYALANENLDEHLYDDAILQLLKSIDADNKFIEAHYLLADVYRLLRRNK